MTYYLILLCGLTINVYIFYADRLIGLINYVCERVIFRSFLMLTGCARFNSYADFDASPARVLKHSHASSKMCL